jgi:cytochrome bd-type quinol oxidase subunit 1
MPCIHKKLFDVGTIGFPWLLFVLGIAETIVGYQLFTYYDDFADDWVPRITSEFLGMNVFVGCYWAGIMLIFNSIFSKYANNSKNNAVKIISICSCIITSIALLCGATVDGYWIDGYNTDYGDYMTSSSILCWVSLLFLFMYCILVISDVFFPSFIDDPLRENLNSDNTSEEDGKVIPNVY